MSAVRGAARRRRSTAQEPPQASVEASPLAALRSPEPLGPEPAAVRKRRGAGAGPRFDPAKVFPPVAQEGELKLDPEAARYRARQGQAGSRNGAGPRRPLAADGTGLAFYPCPG